MESSSVDVRFKKTVNINAQRWERGCLSLITCKLSTPLTLNQLDNEHCDWTLQIKSARNKLVVAKGSNSWQLESDVISVHTIC